jgi:hypothetical protein
MENRVMPATNKKSDTLATVPDTWPGAVKLFAYSKRVVLVNTWIILGLYFSVIVVSGLLMSLFDHDSSRRAGAQVLVQLITLIFDIGIVVAILQGLRDKKITYWASLSEALPLYLNMVLLTILEFVIAVVSLALLVVPFFFVVPRLTLARYFLVDQKLNAIDALKASWRATEGHVGKVYGIIGLSIAMALLMFTIIGIPVALYLLFMYSASLAVLYAYVLEHAPDGKKTA